MLLVINVWGGWVKMQACVGKGGSPTSLVTKCNGIHKAGVRARGHKGWWRWKRSRDRWVLPLQVDNMYTGCRAGELSGRRGGERGAKLNRVREHRRWGWGIFYRYSGEGEAWLKESTPMETNKILFLTFHLFEWFFVCFLFMSEAPLTLRRRGCWPWFYPNTTLHTFVSIPELFCCTCKQVER